MADRGRIAAALAYQQGQQDPFDAVPVAGVKQPLTPNEMTWMDRLNNLSAGLGQGIEGQLEGYKQLVTHPVQSAKDTVQALGTMVKNPSVIVDALKGMGERAMSGSQGLGEVVGENMTLNPRKLAIALSHPNVSQIYMPTRPKMPEAVGKRFSTTDFGGLLPETPFNPEDYLGASIGVIPWDNSSRNRLITNVSETELKNPVLTHGGQPYARDIEHQKQNVAGASAPSIVTRIANRVDKAREENLARGGTGVVLQTPMTMGEFSENYSVMPTQILLDLMDQRNPSKRKIAEINRAIKPDFPDFRGIETAEGRAQLLGSDASIKAPGQLRKAFVDSLYKEDNEKYFGFNRQDISNAITDPSLIDVGRGYGMNTVISHGNDPLTLTASKNATYPTDFSGKYVGTMGNMPIQSFMPEAYKNVFDELTNRFAANNKYPSTSAVHDMTVDALGKRAANVFQFIDEPLVEALLKRRKIAAERGIE